MREKTVKWAERVRAGCIERRDAWQALTMTSMKRLEYPLLALTLTELECNYIMAPALNAGLPKADICRTNPRALVYGCKDYQSLGLHNLHTTKCTRFISLHSQFQLNKLTQRSCGFRKEIISGT